MVADPDLPSPPFPPGDPRFEKSDYLAQHIDRRLSRLTDDAVARPGWGVVFAIAAAFVAGFFLGRM